MDPVLAQAEPIVVDASTTSAPMATSPIEQFIVKPNDPVRQTQTSAALTPPPVVAPAAPVTQAPAEPQLAERLQQASQAYGIDLTGFKDEQSALAHVYQEWAAPTQDIWASDQADFAPPIQQPFMPPQQPAVQQPQPVAAPPAAIPNLDEKVVDPTIVAWAKAQKLEVEKLQAQVRQHETERVAMHKQQVAAAETEIQRRAEVAISGADSALYGSTGKRTAAQIKEARDCAGLVKQIIAKRVATGQPLPQIEEIARIAVAAHKASKGYVAPPSVQPVQPQGQGFSFPPSSPANATVGTPRQLPRISPNNDPFGMFTNPQTRAIIAENLFK